MLADLWFHLSRLLISSCVFSRSGGTGTELADLGPVWADEEARAVLEPEPVSRHNFRHARSSRPAILREEEAGFCVRLHEDGSITWEGHVTLAQTDPSRRAEEARERQLAKQPLLCRQRHHVREEPRPRRPGTAPAPSLR